MNVQLPAHAPEIFTKNGPLNIRPYDVETDATLVHTWVRSAHASYWGMTNASLSEVKSMYLSENEVLIPLMVCRETGPVALVEVYDVSLSPLRDHYSTAVGDLGMHILIKPPKTVEHGFTSCVFGSVLHYCFENLSATRVVVEPDERNAAIRRKNVEAGFVEHSTIQLPDKKAVLSTCTAEQFASSFLSRYVLAKPAKHKTPTR